MKWGDKLRGLAGIFVGTAIAVYLLTPASGERSLAWMAIFVATYTVTDLFYARPGGQLCLGLLLGLNCGANLACWSYVSWSGAALGYGLAFLPILSIFPRFGADYRYQAVIGRANWLLPMSWPINVAGLLFVVASLGGHILLGWRHPFFRIYGVKRHFRTGMVAIRGGWIANLNTYRTAFNMGNITLVHRLSFAGQSGVPCWHLDHEGGHTLNLAAFGWVFHLTGFLHEVLIGAGARALAEKFAESNVPNTNRPHLPLWCRAKTA